MELPELIERLKDTRPWPGHPERVELRQTHISYVFLTRERVYKIKKPVDFGFLDFTTLEKRKYYCEEEVRLNRRLAEGVYLGVEPVTMEDGEPVVGGEGEPVEWAVVMERLPEESFLASMIEREEAGSGEMTRIAERLAAFHSEAETSDRIASFGTPQAVKINTDENFAQTDAQRGSTLPRGLHGRLKTYTDGFIFSNRELLERRVMDDRVRDCHGDLHADHVSLTNGINIFDCIEFNERFRFSDVVADTAFLSMDLDYLGRPDLARHLDTAYFDKSGDDEGWMLTHFYKCYRAYVRGKVEGFRHMEPEVPEEERKRAFVSSRLHYHLAGLYASGGYRPKLVVVCGLSGTGKSSLADSLSRAAGLRSVTSDAVRREIAGVGRDEHAPAGYGEGIYARGVTAKTYREMIRRAEALLSEGRPVVLDATFTERAYLKEARDAAARAGAGFHVVECTASDDVVRDRLAEKAEEGRTSGGAASDADWEIYLRQKEAAEPIEREHVSVNTAGDPLDALVYAVERLYS